MAAEIMTVCGPVFPSDLGIVHSHEHVLWDYWNLMPSYDHIHDEPGVAILELTTLRDAGAGTVVDCSNVGLRTNVQAMPRISRDSGINIVLGTGWYRERVYPPLVKQCSSVDLAEILVSELREGIDGTDVRAGFIGEIGTERAFISPAEERVYRAAALAHQQTGVAIITHTTHFGELANEQIDLLESCDVDPSRIIISHLGDRVDDPRLASLAGRGVYLSIDNIGYQGGGYPQDEVRARNVVRLIELGFVDQIVLGTDIASKSALSYFGGRGYSWLLTSFVPLLRELGVPDSDITSMLVSNMARALTPSIS